MLTLLICRCHTLKAWKYTICPPKSFQSMWMSLFVDSRSFTWLKHDIVACYLELYQALSFYWPLKFVFETLPFFPRNYPIFQRSLFIFFGKFNLKISVIVLEEGRLSAIFCMIPFNLVVFIDDSHKQYSNHFFIVHTTTKPWYLHKKYTQMCLKCWTMTQLELLHWQIVPVLLCTKKVHSFPPLTKEGWLQ